MAEYWFRPKRYGYGATPCTWQGWMFTISVLIAAFACAELARRTAPMNFSDLRASAPFWFSILAAIIVVAGGAYVSRIKTEGVWRKGTGR